MPEPYGLAYAPRRTCQINGLGRPPSLALLQCRATTATATASELALSAGSRPVDTQELLKSWGCVALRRNHIRHGDECALFPLRHNVTDHNRRGEHRWTHSHSELFLTLPKDARDGGDDAILRGGSLHSLDRGRACVYSVHVVIALMDGNHSSWTDVFLVPSG